MELIWGYLLFAATTALAATYELFWPVMSQVAEEDPKLTIVENKKTSVVTFCAFAFAIAPIVLIPSIVPKMGERFRKTLYTALKDTK